MLITGQYTKMLDLRWELEQYIECRGLERELEQQPYEYEQQRGFSRRLRLHPVRKGFSNGIYLKLRNGESGATGICCPALRAKYYLILLFGRQKGRRPGGYDR